MGDVYKLASRVLIYLGNEAGNSNHAMDAIAKREGAAKEVLDLFQRTWFNRVWVLQEVALAECALTICGSKCVPWTCFPAWWASNRASLGELVNPPPGTLAYDPLVTKRLSLLQQLHDTRYSKATDPRDKVYALMGLLSPEDRSSLMVDYTKSVSHVYMEAAEAIVRRDHSLKLLSAVQPSDHSLHGSDLPSWVPDWRSENPNCLAGFIKSFHGAI